MLTYYVAVYDDDVDIERAELYRFFAGLFMEKPADEMLLQAKELFAMKADDMPGEIRLDFTNILSSQGGLLQPYESLYNYPVGDMPRLGGKAAEAARSFYISANLMIDEQINLIPDHISAELLFMGYLVDHGFLEMQKIFMERHLLKWIPWYCDELKKLTNTAFYKEVADLLKEFILSEHELLNG